MQGEGPDAFDAKASAATTAIDILCRNALWAKRMTDLEALESLWGTLALSTEVRAVHAVIWFVCCARCAVMHGQVHD